VQKLNINRQIVEVTKNEGKEVKRIKALREEKPNAPPIFGCAARPTKKRKNVAAP
jgi:hypothetical protein